MKSYPGFFVTFEGGEGSGKSSIVSLFSSFLLDKKLEHLATKEPGGDSSFFGQKIRELLLDQESEAILPETEVLLFAADRAQHVHTTIVPALSEGKIVLCDRYIDSSLVYQGVGRGMGDEVRHISEWATGGLYPDLTFLLDVDPRIGLSRRSSAGGENRIDKESIEFHEAIRESFLSLAKISPERFAIVDASREKNQIFEDVVRIFEEKYSSF